MIGERPIDDTELLFSFKEKKLQHIGSWTVRVASKTDVPDAPSGFRAYSRQAALKMNVVNEYTYTLETIVQAGRNKMAITSVPIRTNPELRKSRLFNSMFGYIKKSMLTIIRAFMMYKPLRFSRLSAVLSFNRLDFGNPLSGICFYGRERRAYPVVNFSQHVIALGSRPLFPGCRQI